MLYRIHYQNREQGGCVKGGVGEGGRKRKTRQGGARGSGKEEKGRGETYECYTWNALITLVASWTRIAASAISQRCARPNHSAMRACSCFLATAKLCHCCQIRIPAPPTWCYTICEECLFEAVEVKNGRWRRTASDGLK